MGVAETRHSGRVEDVGTRIIGPGYLKLYTIVPIVAA